MAEMKMSFVDTQEFKRACTACVNAFGCMVIHQDNVVEIIAFAQGDADVILDTLKEAGSTLLAIVFM